MSALTEARHRITPEDYGSDLAGASILVIDDEPGMRNFLLKTLEPRVKRIEMAASADEASAKLDEHHFDLVILDNVMPNKTGLEWVLEWVVTTLWVRSHIKNGASSDVLLHGLTKDQSCSS